MKKSKNRKENGQKENKEGKRGKVKVKKKPGFFLGPFRGAFCPPPPENSLAPPENSFTPEIFYLIPPSISRKVDLPPLKLYSKKNPENYRKEKRGKRKINYKEREREKCESGRGEKEKGEGMEEKGEKKRGGKEQEENFHPKQEKMK